MPSAQGVLAPYGVCRSSLDFPPPDFCLLTPNLGDDISGTKTGSHVDPAESDLDFADALLRRPEPARQKRRTAPRPRRLCEPSSPSEEARADEALLLRLLTPLRGLARGLLRSGLRLRLCFLRISALLAMMGLGMPCSRESSCTARGFLQNKKKKANL